MDGVHVSCICRGIVLEVGLVMLQGSRRAHEVAIRAASDMVNTRVSIRELRTSNDLVGGQLDAIILPGGESTTMRIVGGEGGTGLLGPLYRTIRENGNMPVLATCAGTILLADPQDGGDPIVSAAVDRNAWGRQIDSFIGPVAVGNMKNPIQCVFIRAPRFTDVVDPSVIATFDGEPVGVRERNRIALTFHPELSGTTIFHEMLIEAALLVQKEATE